MANTRDGSELLTGPAAGGLLRSAVTSAGGVLSSWDLDHVDHRPGRSTKALYRTRVTWPELDGPDAAPREELFGASAHVNEQERHLHGTEQSLVMTDGETEVRVWRYPHDPWLPMLPSVCYPEGLGRTLAALGVPVPGDPSAPVPIDVVSYRPGRRAVLRATLPDREVYLKVMQPHRSGEIVERHQHLLSAGVPVPRVLAHHEGLVVLEELPGRPLSLAVVEEGVDSCRAEDLVALLDRLPASLYTLPLRAPWTESIDFYAGIVGSSLPALVPRLDALVHGIREGLAAVDRRIGQHPHDVVHGDFYEAQVFVEGGEVVGVLDIDTVGPGRRADDLACLLAHLSVLADYGSTGRIPPEVQRRVEEAVHAWSGTFARRVDPVELALRAAGVVLSLATGPHRQQEPSWEAATEAIVRVAELWVDQARRGGLPTGGADHAGGDPAPASPATTPEAPTSAPPAASAAAPASAPQPEPTSSAPGDPTGTMHPEPASPDTAVRPLAGGTPGASPAPSPSGGTASWTPEAPLATGQTVRPGHQVDAAHPSIAATHRPKPPVTVSPVTAPSAAAPGGTAPESTPQDSDPEDDAPTQERRIDHNGGR